MKRRSHRRKSLGVIFLVAFSLLLVACAGPAGRGVGLRSLAADLVFGIPPLEEAVAPPETFPSTAPLADTGGPTGTDFAPRPLPPSIAARGCPDAEVNEVRAEADSTITGGLPGAGNYIWKQSGSQDFGPPIGRLPVPSFAERQIIGVRDLNTSGDFEFTTVQTEVGSGALVSQTFEVIISRPDPRTGPNIVRDEAVTNGVFLTKIVREGQQPFNANPPVLYLPLPVVVGFKRTSQATDPQSLQLLTHSIDVRGRERWDACGEMVDSWFVEGQQTFSFQNETVTKKYNYGVATQMGGLIVFEHVESPWPEGTVKYDTNIGQLGPS